MKLKFLTSMLLLTVISCSAQQVQNRPVAAFDKIQTSGSVEVLYTSADSSSVQVKAKENEIGNVETNVVNGTLIISNKGRFKEPVVVYVKNKRLIHVESGGASDFKSTNVIKSDSIRFDVSGSANVHAQVEAGKLNAIQGGASELYISGTARSINAELSGASTLRGYDLTAKEADVTTTGASTAKIYATDKITANATGASDIRIKGEAKDISADATSAASITRVFDRAIKADTLNSDSTFYHFRHKKVIIVHDKHDVKNVSMSSDNEQHFKHWVGFSLGVNGYMGSGVAMSLPARESYMDLNYARSFNLQLNVLERQFNIVKNYFKVVTGIGLDFHLYELANKTTLNPDSAFTAGTIDTTGKYTYHKNKLRNTYIQVPLLLEFNTSNDPYKTFHIAVGIIGQYLIASRTKQVLEQNGYTITEIRKDSYNMSPFAAKAHINLGYRGWTFFGEYSITALFQLGKGPELHPFTIGLRVIPFA